MSERLEHAREANHQCILLSTRARELFAKEREFLKVLQIDELLQNNAEKARVLSELTETRERFRALRAGLSPEELAKLTDDGWTESWEALHSAAIENRDLLEHSMQNVQDLAENLRHLFLGQTRYSAAGVMHESDGAGKVVEGHY